VGDLEDNVTRCLEGIATAQRKGAELIVLPEMVIPGYHPKDILLDDSFVEALDEATSDLAKKCQKAPPIIVGTVLRHSAQTKMHPRLLNAALLIQGGRKSLVAAKRILPVHDIYHESRWFIPGDYCPPLDINGKKIGILYDSDLCLPKNDLDPTKELLSGGAELLICLSASPYYRGAIEEHEMCARRHGVPLIWLNLVGGNDELVCYGNSFALDEQGRLLAGLAAFREDVQVVDMEQLEPHQVSKRNRLEDTFNALVLGVRDFVWKNRLERAFLGLSGGIDSTLVGVIAVNALGSENVIGVAIPSRYTDTRSTAAARELAETLGIGFEKVEIELLHAAAEETLDDLLLEGATAENVQARLRMMILMSFVNRYGGFLLNTSNKTELSLGYGTIYGDLAGAISPIGDLTKPEVYEMARWISAERTRIPNFILEREPSAELRPGQVDPFDYEVVGPHMEELVESNRSDHYLRSSEHKRQQGGIILKVSEKSFGSGRLFPITRR
jgi:NAD+ synthetase